MPGPTLERGRLHSSRYLVCASRNDELPVLRAQIPRAEVLEHGGNRAALLDVSEHSIACWTRRLRPRESQRALGRVDPRDAISAPTVVHRH